MGPGVWEQAEAQKGGRTFSPTTWQPGRGLHWALLRSGAGNVFTSIQGAWVAIPVCAADTLCLPVVGVYLILSLSPPPLCSLHPTPLPCWLPAHRQTAPYGLGNPPRRRRRSLPKRCECSSGGDPACATFCHRRPW